MIRANAVISRARRDIWDWLMEPAHWKLWGQGDLVQVAPGWQAGASMKWAIGPPSKLAAFQEETVIGIESEFLLSTIGLKAVGPGETEVEIVEAPLRGASFSDAGQGRLAQLDKSLRELKRLMETRPAFLAPLSAQEKLAAGNFPLDVYESIILEKTPGVPNLVMASPGPDAFARLQSQQDILRKLEVGDIRRLKESVAQVMEADLVARGAKPVGPVIVARGGSAQDLVRGAEIYGLAARWNPYNALALMSCGVALAKAGYLREALPWLERAREVDPESQRIKTNIEAIRADVAKSMRSRTLPPDLPGVLPASLAAGAIPPFDLVWPPVRQAAPEASKSRPAPRPQAQLQPRPSPSADGNVLRLPGRAPRGVSHRRADHLAGHDAAPGGGDARRAGAREPRSQARVDAGGACRLVALLRVLRILGQGGDLGQADPRLERGRS